MLSCYLRIFFVVSIIVPCVMGALCGDNGHVFFTGNDFMGSHASDFICTVDTDEHQLRL